MGRGREPRGCCYPPQCNAWNMQWHAGGRGCAAVRAKQKVSPPRSHHNISFLFYLLVEASVRDGAVPACAVSVAFHEAKINCGEYHWWSRKIDVLSERSVVDMLPQRSWSLDISSSWYYLFLTFALCLDEQLCGDLVDVLWFIIICMNHMLVLLLSSTGLLPKSIQVFQT